MPFLDDIENKLAELDEVMLSVDGIEIVITDIGKQTLLDYINFQSIAKSGIVYAPDDDDRGAEVTYHSPEKNAVISIFRHSEEFDAKSISKVCEQYLLLHELFHIKLDLPYDYLDNEKDSIEKQALYSLNHQLVDTMAKSVLLIQYDLDFSWFKNY